MKTLQSIIFFLSFTALKINAQNQLYVPPLLTGTTFNLDILDSTTQFWPGINTITYGINHSILGPTLLLNKGDIVTMNVSNKLTGTGNATTMHWHGLHVPPKEDGGPHQVIYQGSTWSPSFKVMNDAGTFWYHPHGHNKTDRHVSKGLAGIIIVKDTQEATLNLPRTYGVDDLPLVIQTKEFDVLHQIAIATFLDTLAMVNATVNPYINAPAQVVRLRLLNGASQRSFMLGFSNNMNFSLIGNDGGLLDAPQTINRLLIANGERYEILVNLSTLLNDTIYLKCFGTELPKGIYGADTVGDAADNQITDYYNNSLNGTDFNLLQIRIVAPTANPITTISNTLTNLNPLIPDANTTYRNFVIDTIGGMGITPNFALGPFAFNQTLFNMDTVNLHIPINNKEVWSIYNKTMIAHPVHIHDIQFYVLDINGMPPPAYEKGQKDVVLVMPGDSVRIITQFTDFADDSVPYMYHCHILHHEDDGMMGSFLVQYPLAINDIQRNSNFVIYPNPVINELIINGKENAIQHIKIFNVMGQTVFEKKPDKQQLSINISHFKTGTYFMQLEIGNERETIRFIKQ